MDMTWDMIIDACGGTGEVAGALAQSASTVSGWRSRGIPSPHWPGVVRLAASRGNIHVTFEALANLAALKSVEPAEVRA
jgi:hypothetical protein